MIRVWGSLNVCFFTWTLRCWHLSLSRSFLHNHVLVAPKLHLLHESLYPALRRYLDLSLQVVDPNTVSVPLELIADA